jgi:hypothetical protein
LVPSAIVAVEAKNYLSCKNSTRFKVVGSTIFVLRAKSTTRHDYGARTLSIITFSIMTFSILALNFITLRIMVECFYAV